MAGMKITCPLLCHTFPIYAQRQWRRGTMLINAAFQASGVVDLGRQDYLLLILHRPNLEHVSEQCQSSLEIRIAALETGS